MGKGKENMKLNACQNDTFSPFLVLLQISSLLRRPGQCMRLLRIAVDDLKEETYTVVYLDGLLSDKEKEVYIPHI